MMQHIGEYLIDAAAPAGSTAPSATATAAGRPRVATRAAPDGPGPGSDAGWSSRWVTTAVGRAGPGPGPAGVGRRRAASPPLTGRRAHHDELDALLAAGHGDHGRPTTCSTAARPRGCRPAPVLDESGCYADPHLAARGCFRENGSADLGRHRFPGHLWRWDGPELRWGPLSPDGGGQRARDARQCSASTTPGGSALRGRGPPVASTTWPPTARRGERGPRWPRRSGPGRWVAWSVAPWEDGVRDLSYLLTLAMVCRPSTGVRPGLGLPGARSWSVVPLIRPSVGRPSATPGRTPQHPPPSSSSRTTTATRSWSQELLGDADEPFETTWVTQPGRGPGPAGRALDLRAARPRPARRRRPRRPARGAARRPRLTGRRADRVRRRGPGRRGGRRRRPGLPGQGRPSTASCWPGRCATPSSASGPTSRPGACTRSSSAAARTAASNAACCPARCVRDDGLSAGSSRVPPRRGRDPAGRRLLRRRRDARRHRAGHHRRRLRPRPRRGRPRRQPAHRLAHPGAGRLPGRRRRSPPSTRCCATSASTTPCSPPSCDVEIDPDRRSATMRLAGHPPPLVLEPEVAVLGCRRGPGRRWACSTTSTGWASASSWPPAWSLLLYTDGLIEGRAERESGRLGEGGLVDAAAREPARADDPAELVDHLDRHRRASPPAAPCPTTWPWCC